MIKRESEIVKKVGELKDKFNLYSDTSFKNDSSLAIKKMQVYSKISALNWVLGKNG